jgi:hypothetical protein
MMPHEDADEKQQDVQRKKENDRRVCKSDFEKDGRNVDFHRIGNALIRERLSIVHSVDRLTSFQSSHNSILIESAQNLSAIFVSELLHVIQRDAHASVKTDPSPVDDRLKGQIMSHDPCEKKALAGQNWTS